ncbi:MAG: hypothetical protein QW350_04020 [Candidatus Aenigmatarchaeota archaeon]
MSETIRRYLIEKHFDNSNQLSIEDLSVDQLRFFKSLEKRDPLAKELGSFVDDYNVDEWSTEEIEDSGKLLALEDLDLEIKKVSLGIEESIALFKALLEQDIFYGMLIDTYDLNRQLKSNIFNRKISNIVDVLFRIYKPLRMAQEKSHPDRILLEENKLIVYSPYFSRSEAILFSLFHPVSFVAQEKGEEISYFQRNESIKLKVFLYFYRHNKSSLSRLSTELSKEIKANIEMFLKFLDLETYIDPKELSIYSDIMDGYRELNTSVNHRVIYTYNLDEEYRISNLPIKDMIVSIPITLAASKISVPYYGFVGLIYNRRFGSILIPYFTGMMGSPNIRYYDGAVCLGNLSSAYIGNFYVLQDANYNSAYNHFRISNYYDIYLELLKSALIEILKDFQTK